MPRPNRILVYRCGALGDTLVALPAINALRRHFAKASLILMTANHRDGKVWADQVLREFGWFDAFITYRAEELRQLRSLAGLARRVRQQRADLVVHLGSDWNSAARIWRDRLFFAVAGVSRFAGCRSRKVTFWGRLKRRRRIYPSEVIRLLNALNRHGLGDGTVSFDLPIRDVHMRRVSRLLEDSSLEPQRPLIAMCPGSKQGIKRWPVERFAEVGDRLIAEGDANLTIVGGPDEAEVGEQIGACWPRARWINAANQLSVLESADLLRRCLFYVGNDTGAMHLAAAVGTRCVAIFAAREPPQSWYPWGDRHIVLRKNVPCENCYLTACTKEGLRCLTEIGVEEVWSACRQMLMDPLKGVVGSAHQPPKADQILQEGACAI